MILADTSVWIDHFRCGNVDLADLLRHGRVLVHPWVIGELALGHLVRRSEILDLLRNMPQATTATDTEVLNLIDNHGLTGLGIGYVDAHLIAATMLTAGCRLWTRDKRLGAVAERTGTAYHQGP